jgi:phage-related holin
LIENPLISLPNIQLENPFAKSKKIVIAVIAIIAGIAAFVITFNYGSLFGEMAMLITVLIVIFDPRIISPVWAVLSSAKQERVLLRMGCINIKKSIFDLIISVLTRSRF